MKETCVICVETMIFKGSYDCGHSVCGRCTSKFVFLYKDLKCSQCNLESKKIKMTNISSEKDILQKMPHLKDIEINNTLCKNKTIAFENSLTKKFATFLVCFQCKECNFLVDQKSSLLKHYINHHKNIFICKICIDRNFEFWDEITHYTFKEFKEHKKNKHVECKFCDKLYFDLKEAQNHCTEKHQICTICVSLGENHVYFKDFYELEQHYLTEHYTCNQPTCQQTKCYAFAHRSELWAHYKKVHNFNKELDEIVLNAQKNKPPNKLVLNTIQNIEISNKPTVLNPKLAKLNLSLANASKLNTKTEKAMLIGKIKGVLKMSVKMYLEKIVKEFYDIVSNTHNTIDSNNLSTIKTDMEEVLTRYLTKYSEKEIKLMVYNVLHYLYGKENTNNVFFTEYMKEIKYPTFKKTEVKKEEPVEFVSKKKIFKIVDFTSNRKK